MILLGLLAAGVLLTILLLVCILISGRGRSRPPGPRALLKAQARHNAGLRRYIASAPLAGDKRAIVVASSSSSEASVEVTPPPYVKQVSLPPQLLLKIVNIMKAVYLPVYCTL